MENTPFLRIRTTYPDVVELIKMNESVIYSAVSSCLIFPCPRAGRSSDDVFNIRYERLIPLIIYRFFVVLSLAVFRGFYPLPTVQQPGISAGNFQFSADRN